MLLRFANITSPNQWQTTMQFEKLHAIAFLSFVLKLLNRLIKSHSSHTWPKCLPHFSTVSRMSHGQSVTVLVLLLDTLSSLSLKNHNQFSNNSALYGLITFPTISRLWEKTQQWVLLKSWVVKHTVSRLKRELNFISRKIWCRQSSRETTVINMAIYQM
jgi:hypothetical protein